jgi:hypothetical protein
VMKMAQVTGRAQNSKLKSQNHELKIVVLSFTL